MDVIINGATGHGAFAASLLVGGREFETINPLIRALIYDAPDISIMLSVILGAMVVALLFIFTRLESGGTYYSTSKTQGLFKKQKLENRFVNIGVHILAYSVFVIYVMPIVFIVLFSFTDVVVVASGTLKWSSFTLQNYITILSDSDVLRPLMNSIRFSSVAAVLGVFFIFSIVMLQFKIKNCFTASLK